MGSRQDLRIQPDEGPSIQALYQNKATTSKANQIPQSQFDEISERLETDVQDPDWSSRPRTWFILNQIKRVDAMNAFIGKGLNDTSLPYQNGASLPSILNVYERDNFLKWQDSVFSDILHLEKGKHVQIDNGDTLFESRRTRLGTGSQGVTRVDKVISKTTGKVYARKRISRASVFGGDKKWQKIYENELNALQKVNEHEHLIRVIGTYTDKKYLTMLLEPVADENLKEYMSRGPLPEPKEQARFRKYFGCLAHTIRFLHDPSIGILHKDIKPENILLKDGRLILTDFGTAFDWSKTGHSMTRSNSRDCRTPRYQSPEVANLGEFHRSSDIWSLGVVFLEMLTIIRGQTLTAMDTFLRKNDQGCPAIHANLEGAMKWFDILQKCDGLTIDNEPLTWIEVMLNHEQSQRLTATKLYEEIISFSDGYFCGSCCLDEGFQSDAETFSDLAEHDDSISPTYRNDQKHLKMVSEFEILPHMLPGSFPVFDDDVEIENHQKEDPLPASLTDDRTNYPLSLDTEPPGPLDQITAPPSQFQQNFATSASPQKDTKTVQESTPLKELSSFSKKHILKAKMTPLLDIEKFRKLLAWLPDKFAPRPTNHRSRLIKESSSHETYLPTVETQRIEHFLSSLPEETTEFEDAHKGYSGIDQTSSSSKLPIRSRDFPTFSGKKIERSRSQEDLQSSSHLLFDECGDEEHFNVNKPNLVHYASENDLKIAPAVSKTNLQEAKRDLKEFAAAAPIVLNRIPHMPAPNVLSNTFEKSTTSTSNIEPEPLPDSNPMKDELNVRHVRDLNKPTNLCGRAAENSSQSENNEKKSENVAPSQIQALAGASSVTEPPLLGSFIGTPSVKPRHWESATVIMERILDTKSCEAPTTIMSAKTRAKMSQGRPLLRWHDKAYGWLNVFVANGKVGPVRELLKAGCNPGTKEKPRWTPVYSAIIGASDNHTKCLRELVSHGANINAVHGLNGKTPLHYAIKLATWPGYSTVIYVLLAAKADPNVRDKANDLPLLMLLAGRGPLSQAKRDSLYVLLAPNFAINLDVSVSGTLDNPLHLAIRRKDAYTVDAILEKMKQVGGSALDIMHKQNGTGFTPVLLAFTIFTFGDDSDELQIVKLLLNHGANPNDRDTTRGDTPLHQVIGNSKNTTALEWLCRHSVDPTIRNMSGKSAIDLVIKCRTDYPGEKWYLFAERRMSNSLTDRHYRPPELVTLLAEEAERAAASSATPNANT